MSPTLWLRESLNDKRKLRSNLTKFPEVQKKKSSDNVITPDVIAELHMITMENDKLKCENTALKTEYSALRTENGNLLVNIQMNEDNFEEAISKLREEIRINENNFRENNKKCLIEENKFIEEVNELKESKKQLLSEFEEKENNFIEKIRMLEEEINDLQIKFKNIEAQNKENAQKSLKYKGKLKSAVSVIGDLNSMLAGFTSKSEVSHKECQTFEDEKLEITDPAISRHTKTTTLKETEDLMLSDIFFKPRAFCESELVSVPNNSM